MTSERTMANTLQTIPLTHLAIALVPSVAVIYMQLRWTRKGKEAIYGLARMLLQLLLIGYVLGYIFRTNQSIVVLLVLLVMVAASSWIALRTVATLRRHLYRDALLSIALGGGVILILVTQIVLNISPWFQPHAAIPLAGMIFANAMNSVSLAAERLHSELKRETDFRLARNTAFEAATIPIINSLFAVGLVSLPGMMTGQILTGVDPLIAARYQIMVMAMLFSACGLAAALFLVMAARNPAWRSEASDE
jgi:putative ABC transport system permease protein